MTRGATALLYGVVFFSTCGVALWAVTLPEPWAFVAGGGWMLVLVAAHRWEESIGRRPSLRAIADYSSGVVAFPDPSTVATRRGPKRIWEEYSLNHNVRDLATLPCRYGCIEPVACPFPHGDCPHCIGRREAAGLMTQPDAG